ncbi:MAG: GNAT family N-acetyltransferase [Actinomycetota bacterium]|nr:GNAT family N-acetyltransferase [Actinomycetota bacterium]
MAGADRVMIEPLVPAHAELLYEPLRDDRLYRYIDERPPSSLDALRQRYAFLATETLPDRDETWRNWLARRRDNGDAVGTVQATIRDGDSPASIAYVFLHRAWGRGYASEAVRMMLRELAEVHGVATAQAEIDPGNERSIRLVRRLGFERAGAAGTGELIYRTDLAGARETDD